eukprot:augustus_masked-scaffold_30-processed-gene-2.69-mRNA-1 protein AED:0.48 eAED:0.48 QI:0/-1/0/1/-1/1/1/0/1817
MFIEQLVIYSPGQEPTRGRFVEHFDTKYLIYRNNTTGQHSFKFQKAKDVIIQEFSLKKEIFNLCKKILNVQDIKIDLLTIPDSAVKARKLEVTPLSEIDTVVADELAAIVDKQEDIKPILIKNMLDRIPEEFNEKGLGEGNISEEQEKQNINEMIRSKVEACEAAKEEKTLLDKILRSNLASFGLEQSNARMSYLTPIEVDLIPGHKVIKCSGYHFTNEEEEFIQRKFISLQKAGIAEPSKNPLWGFPIFVVPKKIKTPSNWEDWSPEQRDKWNEENLLNRYRMVANMVRLNDITIRTSLDLPNLERQMTYLRGTKYYLTLDILSGFDFLATKPEHRKYFTLITRRGAWQLNGAPMGWANTPALFCDRIVNDIIDDENAGTRFFCRPKTGALAWLDDLLLYSDTFEGLMNVLKEMLERAARRNIRFNLRKCEFLEKPIVWCGREIRSGSWNFAEKYYETIMKMPKPEFKHQAAQLIYLLNWLSPNIPKFADLRLPFSDQANLQGKTLKQVEKERIRIDWTDEMEAAYAEIKIVLTQSSKRFLANYDEKAPILLFTDASKYVWSLSVFQDDPDNITNNVQELKPRPLLFLSGKFKVNEARWHISSKELYPVIYSFERIGFILKTHRAGIYLYTDHKALLTVLKSQKNEKRIYWDRLYRWSIKLQEVELTVFHLSSRDNFIADILTRWAHEAYEDEDGKLLDLRRVNLCINIEGEEFRFDHEETTNTLKLNDGDVSLFSGEHWTDVERNMLIKVRATSNPEEHIDAFTAKETEVPEEFQGLRDDLIRQHVSFLSPYFVDDTWKPFTEKELVEAQKALGNNDKYIEKEGIYYMNQKKVIPPSLVTRVIVGLHVSRGHPSEREERLYLKEFYFAGLKNSDVELLLRSFRRRCLHCSRTPRLIRRPFNLTQLATNRRQILHADYLYVNTVGYILVVLDGCTRKTQLTFSENASSEAVVDALLKWRGDFGFNPYFLLVTDNASHFANDLMEKLTRTISFEQSFSIAYAPWTNGAIETTNSIILKHMRSLISQYSLHETQWPSLIPLLNHIINNKPSDRRGGYTSNELFLFYRLETPLYLQDPKHFSLKIEKQLKEPKDPSKLMLEADNIMKILDERCRKAYELTRIARLAENKRKSKNISRVIQFSPGDYVLVSEKGTMAAQEKTRITWHGPYQVTEIVSRDIYKVESLMGKERIVHATRMWFYSTKKPLGNHKLRQVFMHNFDAVEVDRILDVRLRGTQRPRFEAKIRWRGFDKEDDEWLPLKSLYNDLPELVLKYLETANMLEAERRVVYNRILKWEPGPKTKKMRKRIKANAVKMKNDQAVYPKCTLGWYAEEKEVLEALIKKLGCGNYDAYLRSGALPRRNKQQLSTQVQKLLNVQAIGPFHGMNIDPKKVRKFLSEEMGIHKFTRRLPGQFISKQGQKELIAVFRRELHDPDLKNTTIVPYFRRLEDPTHLRIAIDEWEKPECQEFFKSKGILSKQELEDMLAKYEVMANKQLKDIEPELDLIAKLYGEDEILFYSLHALKTLLDDRSMVPKINLEQQKVKPYFATGSLVISFRIHRNMLEVEVLEVTESKKIVLYFLGGNVFKLAGTDHLIHMDPPMANPILCNVFDLTFDSPKKKKNRFHIVLMDPPWGVGTKDPTRGVSLKYPTISLERFNALKFPPDLLFQPSYLLIWVTNHSYFNTITWAQNKGYALVDEIIWIKRHNSGSLAGSLGRYLQHAQETCLIFMSRSKSGYFQDVFQDINQFQGSSPIVTNPQLESFKPLELYTTIEDTWPHMNYLELFGTHRNLRPKWTTVGLTLIPHLSLNYLFYKHEEWDSPL